MYLKYGLYLLDEDRPLDAAFEFQKATELHRTQVTDVDEDVSADDEYYKGVFNAAVAFRLAGKRENAERFYRKAVELRSYVSLIINSLVVEILSRKKIP